MELAHPSILKATTTHTQFPQMAVFLPLTWEKNQSLDYRPPSNRKPDKIEIDLISLNQVRCQQRLGGLLKSYSRAA